MTSDQIRAQFIDFFVQKHGHTFVPSSPVVPLDDPTLLFTNAGMNQFKPIFLGQETRPYRRAANTQKCIRAGGKHNDLDDVGRSRRHHTFFEMLGNWSFGDYFKRGAIEMAWELLTHVWELDPRRLHVTCYEGNPTLGIPRDTEAADLWKQIAGLNDDHIHYFGKDNFWEMGETGPCGPCTEIFIDRTPNADGGNQVNGVDPRVMEIWNLVFIQYNRDAAGKLTTLPAQHVDTGMGLERICQVLQAKEDNYATDLWTPLFTAIADLSGCKYTGQFPRTNFADPVAEAANQQLRHDIAFRVVADHLRCLTFALTDGAVPSNEGRGYVLRRILRRAVRFGRQQLGLNDAFLHKLVPVVVSSMSGAFPELRKNPNRVMELIKEEEISFGRTLVRGIEEFERAYRRVFDRLPAPITSYDAPSVDEDARIQRIMTKHQAGDLPLPPGLSLMITAEDAFKLHDTYGFPIDLTRIMAEERGMQVDIAGYEKLMEQAREIARAGGKEGEARIADLTPDAIAVLQGRKINPTNDQPKFKHDPVQATIEAISDGEKIIDEAGGSGEFAVILNHTNFYAEMGGQIGDSGELRIAASGGSSGGAAIFDVRTTKSVAGFILHIGMLRSGHLRIGDTVTATVLSHRELTEKNHTSTHLANWALREVLGDDVQQKGSLVDPDKLRFDFSHPKAMTDEQIDRVTHLVNNLIDRKLPVYAEVAPQEKALKISGLRAVFGEKYPPMVRVVSIGAPVADLLADPANPKWRQFSIEFCGGTHLQNSSQAETFTVTAEESVSKGIRRIVALTGDAAKSAAESARQLDKQISQARQSPDADLAPHIATIQKSLAAGNLPLLAKRRAQTIVAELQSRLKAFEKSAKPAGAAQFDTASVATDILAKAADIAGAKIIVAEIPGATDEQLRTVMDSLRKRATTYGIMLASAADQRVNFVAAVSDDLIARGLKAGDWIRETAKVTGGGGGGRPQLAQAGGKDPAKIPDALRTAHETAQRTLAK